MNSRILYTVAVILIQTKLTATMGSPSGLAFTATALLLPEFPNAVRTSAQFVLAYLKRSGLILTLRSSDNNISVRIGGHTVSEENSKQTSEKQHLFP